MRHAGTLVPRALLALLVALAALAAGSGPAEGASFTIDATHDAVDASPGDGVCADATGACTLRAAVMETNALPGADEISLPAGTFVLSIPGAGEDAAATGDLDITDHLAIGGKGATSTALDGGGLDRVLHIDDAMVSVSDVTIQNGKLGPAITEDPPCYLDLDGTALYGGAGICNRTGHLSVRATAIANNEKWQFRRRDFERKQWHFRVLRWPDCG